MSFGERLKYLREKKEMYQSELAEKLNLAPSTISMYERGDRDPDTSTLIKISEIFEVSTDYLLGRTNEPNEIKQNELHMAASSGIDLAKLAEISPEKKKMIEKTTNEMIDMFYKEFGKKD